MLSDAEISEIKALLLAPELSEAQAAATLRKFGFRHPRTADANLQSMAGEPHTRVLLAELLPRLLSALAQSADPDMGLNNLQRFVEAAISRETLFHSFLADPGALELLLIIFTTSQHLSEILIQNGQYLDWIRGMVEEDAAAARQRMLAELRQNLSILNLYEHRLEEMRRFKNIELLRIGMRDLVHEEDVDTITRRLTALAEAELEVAIDVALKRLAEKRGWWASELPRSGFAVIGLGKLGGAELNYSSDIDILFVYDTTADYLLDLSPAEYYDEVGRLVVEAMSRPMVHGHVCRVDMRLRPDGYLGELVRSAVACLNYYRTRAAAWERQALLKARFVAGDAIFGERFAAQLSEVAYEKEFAKHSAAQVRQMKERIEAELHKRNPHEKNVKLGQGGIRDIEFIVQFLQLQYGWRNSRLRTTHTLDALRRLHDEGYLNTPDAQAMEAAYVFLRKLEHRLQMMHALQIHSLPHEDTELQKLAIRMGFQDEGKSLARELFVNSYELHTRAVREIFEKVVRK